jgi:hypothetical protein
MMMTIGLVALLPKDRQNLTRQREPPTSCKHKSQTHQHEDLRPQLPEEPLDSEYRYEREDVARTISPRQTTRTTTDPYLMLFLMID